MLHAGRLRECTLIIIYTHMWVLFHTWGFPRIASRAMRLVNQGLAADAHLSLPVDCAQRRVGNQTIGAHLQQDAAERFFPIYCRARVCRAGSKRSSNTDKWKIHEQKRQNGDGHHSCLACQSDFFCSRDFLSSSTHSFFSLISSPAVWGESDRCHMWFCRLY